MGVLTVERQGLVTAFTARCEDPGRLVRLSVYGGGVEGYLGVMEPTGGRLVLCRKLTREAMRGFPEHFEYAAEAGNPVAPAPPPKTEEKQKTGPQRPANCPANRGGRQSREQGSGDVLWAQVGEGSLYARWKGREYRAIPMAAWGLPLEQAVDRRVIGGVEYAVFALKDGVIVKDDT